MEKIIETPVQVSEKIKHLPQQSKAEKESYRPIDNKILEKYLPKPMQVVQTPEEEQELYDLWDEAYKEVYPDYEVNRNDPHNTQAHILYTRDENGKVVSSIRLTLDSSLGIPSEEYYQGEANQLREHGYNLMELGRMVYIGHTLQQMKAYYQAMYEIAKAESIDIIMMSLKQKDVAFHRNLIGAYTLIFDIGMPTGSKHKMSTMAWEIKQTKPRFFKWTGISKQTTGAIL